MMLHSLELTPEQRLSGRYDYGIITFNTPGGKMFAAWTKTAEGPARPDRISALADLRDMLAV